MIFVIDNDEMVDITDTNRAKRNVSIPQRLRQIDSD